LRIVLPSTLHPNSSTAERRFVGEPPAGALDLAAVFDEVGEHQDEDVYYAKTKYL